MDLEDLYTSVGALISAISAALSWIWNIAPLQFIFTFILGSCVTYFIQSKLQDRSEKRKIRREIIEKIYGPLYIELQDIQQGLIKELEQIYTSKYDFVGGGESSNWSKVQKYPEFFSIPFSIREDLQSTIESAEWFNNSMASIKKIIDSVLYKKANKIFKSCYEDIGEKLSEKMISLRYLNISYEPKLGGIENFQLSDFVILDKNPVEDLIFRYPDYDQNRSKLHLYVETVKNEYNKQKHKNIYVPLPDIEHELLKLLKETKEELSCNHEVSKFLEKRIKLKEKCDKLIDIIEKHIEKYYPIDKIS